MNKRCQVSDSPTYADLQRERQEVNVAFVADRRAGALRRHTMQALIAFYASPWALVLFLLLFHNPAFASTGDLTEVPSVDQREAIEKYRLAEVFEFLDPPGEVFPLECRVRVQEGDLKIEGGLRLDWAEYRNGQRALFKPWLGHCGLVVTGKLEVGGSVVNANSDSGPFLIVLESLTAAHLVVGGSSVSIGGNATVRGLILGFDYYGQLHLHGDSTAALVIASDHELAIQTTSPLWDFNGVINGMPLSEYLHPDIDVEVDEDLRPPIEYVAAVEQLVERILAEQPVLRPDDDPRPRKDGRAWLADVREFGCALRHVPAALLTPEIATAGVSTCGSALRFVPEGMRTRELCQAAMADDPDAFAAVPEALRTEAWSHRAVEYDGENLRFVPPAFITAELAQRAVVDDSDAIFAVPERIHTEELEIIAVTRRPWMLGRIPVERRTINVSFAAVRRMETVLEDVPAGIRDEVLRRVRAAGPPRETLSKLPDSPEAVERFDAELREIFRYSRKDYLEAVQFVKEAVEVDFPVLRAALRDKDDLFYLDFRLTVGEIGVFGRRAMTEDVYEEMINLGQSRVRDPEATGRRLAAIESRLRELLKVHEEALARWATATALGSTSSTSTMKAPEEALPTEEKNDHRDTTSKRGSALPRSLPALRVPPTSATRNGRTASKPFKRRQCYNCHVEYAADDNVFTQFYPVLRRLKEPG